MDRETVALYNKHASKFAEKFQGIGSRVSDIERAFQAFGKENPRTLELGCGDGRDAVEIHKRTNYYIGTDASEGMIAIARTKIPEADFRVIDIASYPFDEEIDIVFAFASLLHVDRDVFEATLKRARKALSRGGIFYISVKRGDYKGAEVVRDKYGDRVFYYYEREDIEGMTEGYEILFVDEHTIGKSEWLVMMLKKI